MSNVEVPVEWTVEGTVEEFTPAKAVVICSLNDWALYLTANGYEVYQNVPNTPPSYPCIVHSMVLNMGDYEFIGHSFITVEDIEKPDDVNYSGLEEAEALMAVAEDMYGYYGDAASSELRNRDE